MIYFIIYLLIEVLVTSDVAVVIGGFSLFFEILISAGIGLFILTNFRYTAAQGMSMMMSGKMSLEDFQKFSLFTLLGAFLLIIPGVFSDIIGLLLQFSSIGTFFAKYIFNLKTKKTKKKEYDDNAIDVEVIDISDSK